MTTPAVPIKLNLIAVVVVAFVATQAILVVAAFAWVFIYSALIDPGRDAAHYQAYARAASPVVAVLLAGPVYFAMGRFMRRYGALALKAAFAVVALNLLLDAATVSVFAVDVSYNVVMSMLAAAAKIVGAYLGARPRFA